MTKQNYNLFALAIWKVLFYFQFAKLWLSDIYFTTFSFIFIWYHQFAYFKSSLFQNAHSDKQNLHKKQTSPNKLASSFRWSKSPSHLAVLLPFKYDALDSFDEKNEFFFNTASKNSFAKLKLDFLSDIQNIIRWSILYQINSLSIYSKAEAIKTNVPQIVKNIRNMLLKSSKSFANDKNNSNIKILLLSDDSSIYILPEYFNKAGNNLNAKIIPDITIRILSRNDGYPKILNVSKSIAQKYSSAEITKMYTDFDISEYLSNENNYMEDPQLVVIFDKHVCFDYFPCLLLKSAEIL
ncbi:hypothetical protein BB561_002324 [Smittium simulii]|uniref:ditrans,polycis-polyprenyl diphosphate synthase [(2E,6E)-farnesyldiphosphate specific] n=1 Tax=Smittium simulii TaxID=133385 RepID=A0A2T9YQY2_9FUNG|nr:hypothetical protein BB561_002324 [Smittium simulii]